MMTELGRQLRGQTVRAKDDDAMDVSILVSPYYGPEGKPANAEKPNQKKHRKDAESQSSQVPLRYLLDSDQEHHQQRDSEEKMRNQRRQTPSATETVEMHVLREQHPGEDRANDVDQE